MPILVPMLIALLVAEIGFSDTLAVILGAVGLVILPVLTRSSASVLAMVRRVGSRV